MSVAEAPLAPISETLTSAVIDGRDVTVTFADRHRCRFNVLWLRDNCASGGDKLSALRSFTIAGMDPDLAPTAVALSGNAVTLTWPDGTGSVFDGAWLRAHSCEPDDVAASRRPLTLWDTETIREAAPTADFAAVSTDAGHHAAMLRTLHDHGFVLMNNVPATAQGTEDLAATVGYIRETDFGRVFDIVSEPEVWEMSQSQEALHPHTDDPYRYTPPGISILHCLEASGAGGGTSQIVDGFAAAEALRASDPEAFALLATTPVPWVRYRADPVPQGQDVALRAVAPIIRLDRDGALAGIRFHERSMGTLDIAPEAMDAMYRAMIAFADLLYGPRFRFEHHLEAGQAFVFDNHRVLHGRGGFAGAPGRRHMRITTTDRDAFHSRLRLAVHRAGRSGVWDALPQGAG
jgi:gamma-butyrobetaine dioxygenase